MENPDPALSAVTFTNNPTLTAALARLKAQKPAAVISGIETDGTDAGDNTPKKDEPMLAASPAVAQFNHLVAEILREPVPAAPVLCKHDMKPATCSLCNPPQGRKVSRTATGALANKGRRRVKRVKHTRPGAWTPLARAAVSADTHAPLGAGKGSSK